MNRAFIRWCLVCSIASAPALASVQEREPPKGKPPAGRPAQERPPKPPAQKPREQQPPDYGVPGGYDVVSPVYANFYLFARLLAASRKLVGLRARLRLWIGPPEQSSHLVHSAARGGPPRTILTARALFAVGVVLAGMLALARFSLPMGWVASVTLASIVFLEAGCALFDGRLPGRT